MLVALPTASHILPNRGPASGLKKGVKIVKIVLFKSCLKTPWNLTENLSHNRVIRPKASTYRRLCIFIKFVCLLSAMFFLKMSLTTVVSINLFFFVANKSARELIQLACFIRIEGWVMLTRLETIELRSFPSLFFLSPARIFTYALC